MNTTFLSKKSLDIIHKSKKIAVIATGVVAAATGLYLLFRKTEEQPSFVGDVDIEYNKEYLTVVTIRQVNKACLKKILVDYKNLVCEYRKKRREIIGDLEKYIQTCIEYNKNLESLISEGRKEVLKHLEISEQMWDDSISYYIKKNNSKVMMLCATFQANLKERIESQITLSIQQFLDVLIQHTDFLKQEEGMINKIQATTRDKQKAVEIFETLIHDQIYAKFRIEEEDFFAAMNNLAGLPEIQVAAMEFIREINRLSISSLRTSQSFLLAKKI